MINRIEIDFCLPVEPEDRDYMDLDRILSRICDQNCPEGYVFWPAGHGSKPCWSRMDALFLGKVPEEGAPDTGEPTFDDSIYHVECAAREAYPEEIERKKHRAAEKARRRRSWRFRLERFLRRLRDAWEEEVQEA